MPYRLRDGKRIVYEDSFLAERTYGGQRKHYGTDLMDLYNTPGEIPIYSMTYGRVSRMGWNEKEEAGGLASHPLPVSITITLIWQLLRRIWGWETLWSLAASSHIWAIPDMDRKGTRGQFAVHLHLGIQAYPDAEDAGWINPYPFLQGKKS